ncbi:MAG: hypothetical protein RLZZ142_177 [Verrucomicrobiota bacterium]
MEREQFGSDRAIRTIETSEAGELQRGAAEAGEAAGRGGAPLLPWAVGALAGILAEDALRGRLPPGGAGSGGGFLGWGGEGMVLLGFAALAALACLTSLARPRPWLRGTGSFLAFAVLHHVWDSLSPSRPPEAFTRPGYSRVTTLTGIVRSPPEPLRSRGGTDGCRFRLELDEPSLPEALPPGASVLALWQGPPPQSGDRVRLRGALRCIAPPRNPGAFDQARRMRREGLWMEAAAGHPRDGTRLGRASPGDWRAWRDAAGARVAEAVRLQLQRGIEGRLQTQALLSSMVLGIHGEGLQEARETFRDTGTLHLFAVSGLNLSMLASFLSAAGRVLSLSRRMLPLLVIPALGVYALACGLGASCSRALIMGCIGAAAPWVEHPPHALNSLCAAALILCACDTNHPFEASFQLSFALVLVLILAAPRLARLLARIARPDALLPRPLWSAFQRGRVALWNAAAAGIAASLACWVGCLPWSFTLFHQITPVSLLANFVAIPVSFLNLSLGFLSLLCAPLPALGIPINRANATAAETLLHFLQWAAKLPGGRLAVAHPLQTRPLLLVFDLPGSSALAVLPPPAEKTPPWLLNCGTEAHFRSTIQPALRFLGVDRIHALLLTHGSAPHIAGALAAVEALQPQLLLQSGLKDRSRTRRDIASWMEAQGKPMRSVLAPEQLAVSPHATLEILFPPPGIQAGRADDKALVLRWRSPECTFLYTASAGFRTEQWLLAHCREQLAADLWIRSPHPRDLSGTADFVHAVNPAAVIVTEPPSLRADPEEPRRWAESWRAAGLPVLLQSECGAVRVYSHAPGLRLETQLPQGAGGPLLAPRNRPPLSVH